MPTYICQYACNLRSNLQFTPTEIPRSRKLIGFMEFQTIWEGWVGQCLMNGVPGVCRSGQRASEGVFWAEIPCLSAVVGKNCGGRQEVGRLHWRGRGWEQLNSAQTLRNYGFSLNFFNLKRKKKSNCSPQINFVSLSKSMMNNLPVINRPSIVLYGRLGCSK